MDLSRIIAMWEAGGPGRALIVALVAALLSLASSMVFRRLLFRIARRTETALDDIVVGNLRLPTAATILLGGVWYATTFLDLPPPVPYLLTGSLFSATALTWGYGGSRLVGDGLDWLVANRARYETIVTARTEPVFDVAGKTFVYGATLYFVFLAWDIDLSGWLASAGIIGVAVGFASQDTLSNLVAGIFVLADAPYKLGDFLVLESGDRGRVTEIGMLVTRLLTNDDVEIIVPNRMMANSRIVNESGGPHQMFRIRIPVGVAYGSDIDLVRKVLLDEAATCANVVSRPAPLARIVRFGESSVDFEVQVWCEEPRVSEVVRDEMHTRIYKAFAANDITIPFPQRDVHVRR